MSKEGYNETNNNKTTESEKGRKREFKYGTEPSAFVREIPKLIKKGLIKPGRVTDIGAAYGRDILFLAEEVEFEEVTAIDINKDDIETLKEIAKKKNLKINYEVADIRTWEFKKQQDIIIANGVLHFLSRVEALEVIRKIKASTCEGGVNVIGVITREGDFFNANPKTDRFYPAIGELKKLYEGWEIKYKPVPKSEAAQKFPDGSPMYNTVDMILARKPLKTQE